MLLNFTQNLEEKDITVTTENKVYTFSHGEGSGYKVFAKTLSGDVCSVPYLFTLREVYDFYLVVA